MPRAHPAVRKNERWFSRRESPGMRGCRRIVWWRCMGRRYSSAGWGERDSMGGMTGSGQRTTDFLAVVLENVELRQQPPEVQNRCIELAVDAGGLHAEIEMLRAQLLAAERACDRWRVVAEKRLAG